MPLSWSYTWGRRQPDFVAHEDGWQVARIYKASAPPGQPEWFWAVDAVGRGERFPEAISGRVHTKREAVERVRATWAAAKAWSAENRVPLFVGARLREADP